MKKSASLLALSPASLRLLANWKRTDRKFFRKYMKDSSTMEVVASLAELIATYELRTKEPNSFYC